MGFYRIIKNIVRFILYQMPRKWLVMIIFALVMTFGLTKVKGYEYVDINDVDFLSYVDLKGSYFDTGIHINSGDNDICNSFKIGFQQGSVNGYNYVWLQGTSVQTFPHDITQRDLCFVYINGNTNRQFYYNNVSYANGLDSIDTNYYYKQEGFKLYRSVSNENNYTLLNTFSSNFSNTTNYKLIINPNSTNSKFRVFDFVIYTSSTGVINYHFYPCKVGNDYGFYDSINYNFYKIDNITGTGTNPNPPLTVPYISNTTSSIRSYSFDFLNINGVSLQDTNEYGQNYFSLVTDYMGISVTTDLDNYKQLNGNSVNFSVPKSELIDNPSIATGRSVTWTLLYYKSIEGGRDIIEYDLGTYTFDLTNNTTEENNTIQQDTTLGAIAGVSSSINNMNNNINNVVTQQEETNNFLQDTNVNSNNKNIPSPTIANSQVISQIDGAYTDFFNDYLYLFASDLPVTINLYIPNMSNGSIASTISIPSNYVKAHLNSVNIPFINYSLLELIYMVWSVVFAFWFLGFATNLITILYSGEIMNDKGLSNLTKTYTGISKNML